MKVRELLANLANVDPELEIFTGTGDEYLNAVTENDVNVQETVTGQKVLTIQGQGELAKLPVTYVCQRCSSVLKNGMCADETCPFSDHVQNCRMGWAGHPSHVDCELPCTCMENSDDA